MSGIARKTLVKAKLYSSSHSIPRIGRQSGSKLYEVEPRYFANVNLRSTSPWTSAIFDAALTGFPWNSLQVLGTAYLMNNNNNPNIIYTGTWTTTQSPGSILNDQTSSTTTGDSAQKTFIGTEVQWICTKANNRGKADRVAEG